MSSLTRPTIDLLDPAFHVGDPHPAYRWMRQHEPIYRDEHNQMWCLSRMEHVRHVERHPEPFTSARGYRSVWVPTETSMISRDDPRHAQQRKVVAARFTPRAASALEEQVRSIVDEAITMFSLSNRVEIVDALAARVPSVLTCRLIGWDDSQWRDVRSWSERLMRIDTMGIDPSQMSDGFRAVTEIARLAERTLAQRRQCPADDLLTAWAQAAPGGCPMSDEEISSELGLFIPGGAETTRTTMARALILFAERPELWEQLAADPSSIAAAVEELLRWITPLNNMFRVVTEDVDLDGVHMRAGERIALAYPSANRDEDVFESADEVRLGRDPNPHIAFGFGTHFCLGAHIARLVLRVTLERLSARITNLRPESPPRYEANVFVKAVERFDLGFDWR